MNTRDHYTPGQAPDWSRPGNAFKPLAERGTEPVSIAWRRSELRASERAKLADAVALIGEVA